MLARGNNMKYAWKICEKHLKYEKCATLVVKKNTFNKLKKMKLSNIYQTRKINLKNNNIRFGKHFINKLGPLQLR